MFYTQLGGDNCGRFVYYAALTFPFSLLSTNTAVPSMTQQALADILLAVPKKDEQQQIACFLDRETGRIDTLIAKQQRLIELLQEKRQSLITRAVTKGLDLTVPMKDSGVEWLGEVPAHWEVKPLRHVCQVETGSKDTINAIDDGGYPFFVRSQVVERIETYTFDCEAVMTAGDGVGVGKVFHHFLGRFDAHQRVYVLHGFKEITGKLLYYVLRETFHRVALEGGAKSTVDSLRRPMFQTFPVAVPHAAEQREIVAFAESVDSRFSDLIAKTERMIELAREHRSTLISAAVTGKIDVREVAGAVTGKFDVRQAA